MLVEERFESNPLFYRINRYQHLENNIKIQVTPFKTAAGMSLTSLYCRFNFNVGDRNTYKSDCLTLLFKKREIHSIYAA